jgi:hypothetical protein
MRIKFSSEDPKERDHSQDLGVDWRIILEWMLGNKSGKVWTRFI